MNSEIEINIKRYQGVVFFDGHNGASCPMSFEDILEQVKADPCCSEDPEKEFWFSEDNNVTFCVQEIVDILGIDLEEF